MARHGFSGFLFTICLSLAASSALAATTDFRVLLDVDNNAATGCTVSGMSGVDQILLTRVETTATAASVTRTSRQVCTAGVLGAETDVITTGWSAGFDPASGRLLVETRLPISAIGTTLPHAMRIGVEAQQGSAIHTAIARPDGSGPVFPEMPRGRRRATSPPGPARVIIMDGDGTDWLPLTALIDGIAAGGSSNLRILKFFAFPAVDGFLYFRFDANLSTDAPIAVDDEFPRPVGAGVTVPPPGVLLNDINPSGTPLTALPVSQPAHGDLTLNPDGGFTYTPNDPSSTQTDSFEYKASNGKESNAARVAIPVALAENTAPIFSSTSTPNVAEGTTTVVTLNAPDSDGDTVTYSITGGADQSRFSITGGNTLVFNSAPDYEVPLSAGGSNSYLVEVTANDGEGHTTVQSLTVTVTNVDEAPVFTGPSSFSVQENTTAVGSVNASDPDGTGITYSISGADAADFTINSSNGTLTFASAPDFESPADSGANNVYTVQVTATDATGSATVQTVNVTVSDVNEAPVFTSSATPSMAENTTAAVTVTVDDPEGNAIVFSITGGADQARFTINPATGALSFLAAPNFEVPTDTDANNIYVVQVTATDGATPIVQNIAVTVTNVNEPPSITSANVAAVAENTTAVLTVTSTDPEGNTIAYSVSGGADAALFTINASTGALTFITAPNFEAPADAGANNVYDVTVTANDGTNNVAQSIAVTVTNVNEAPAFTSTATPSVAENTTAVVTVTTADQEGQAVVYTLTGGADQARFSINASTGALTFNAAPNFEAPADADANNIYLVQVTASDGTNNAVQNLAVTVTNVNEAPVITSSNTATVPENTIVATTVTATDQEGNAIAYSLTGGADQARFSIDATTGVLSFNAAPNFEAPADANTDNQYVVQVTVTDGTTPVNQTITVTVTNVNEAPVFTSGTTPSVVEGTTAVTTVTTTDEEGNTVTYSIVGGADAADFSIDAATGALTFNVAPNYEAPADADTNNVYSVTVRANDGTNNTDATLTVTVTDANEAPSITSANAASVPENTTAAITVTSTDPEGNTVTYSITGGADAARFSINATTGALTFNAAPNFEAPADAGANNVYDVQVTATDGTNPVAQNIAITVTDVNEAPLFTSSASPSAAENQTAAVTVTTTDQEGNTITYSITGGADAALFSINSSTGVVTFNSAPNFEAPADAGANNVYDIVVTASDGTNTPTQNIAITVTDVNEAPLFTSSNTPSAAENQTAAVTVTTTDQEGNTITYSISGGADAALFSINSSTGVVTFNSAPNFEAPADAGANNVYDIVVTASDGTNTPTQNIAITVTDANEAPLFTSSASPSAAENQTAAVTVTATDAEGNTITYSISGGADAALFSINSSTGVVTFNSAPNFEAPADAGANNVYDIVVTASDGTNTPTQNIAVTVTDVNEAPSFTSSPTPSAAENQTAAVTVTTTDPEGNTVTYSITGGADAALFSINTSTGVVTFNSAPNFEAPADAGANNVYDIVVTATDGTNSPTQNIAITVTNANEAPSFTSSATPSVAENTVVATTVTTSDPDGNTTTYSITGGADAADFSIDSTTGVLSFVVTPNFEAPHDADANNVYLVQVTATDGTNPVVQNLSITVTDTNEAPSFNSSATPSVAENTTAVVTASATDPEGQTVTYSITGGADAADFTIDGNTGALSFAVAPNFEAPHDADTNNVYLVQVTATDGTTPAVQNLTVTVTNGNDAPSINSGFASINVNENVTAVATITSTDPDGDTRSYSIGGGADAALFSINSTSGELTFNAAPNFEAPSDAGANNVYDVVVRVSDGSLSDDEAIAVTVQNVNEAPVYSSSSAPSVPENTTAVVTVQATDPEGQTVTYSITGGADQAKFAINGTTGALSFLAAPDFEAPTDADTNNTYIVQVTATDGSVTGAQTITVTVTDANDPPVFTSSATPSAAENQTVAVDVNATDPEAGTVTYSITGGADAADFSINGSTGVVSFVVTPNFEAPHDADTNNTYLVQVTVTDGMNPAVQNITVTVTNVNEAPSITSTNTYSIPENISAVTTVAATDPENDTVTYSITGGADAADFSINGTSGALTFATPPNFEAPADANVDNIYIVQVTATDGTSPVNQTITVTVTNVDEAPVFATANTASVAENQTAVVTLSATDPEGTTVTYSITGGADQGDFAVNATTGELTFNPAPNFEAPADADTNNSYIVQVTATDGANPVNLTITITVTNVNEAPVNTVPAGTQTTPEDTNLVFPGTMSVSDPDGDVTVQVTLTATKGTLTIPVTTGLTFTTGDGSDDATLVFTGTTSTINTRLNGMFFKPAANYYSNDATDADGPGSVTMLTNDQGNTGSGGALSSNGGTADSVTIDINAVNDKPTTASYTVADNNAHITHSGVGITISAADSNELKEDSADVDNHDPYSELTVEIVGGSISPANSTVTLIDASTGAFYFEPPGGLSGSGAASFQYRVCDNGSVALGLAAQCSDPATVQFTITGPDTWYVDDTDAAGCGASCNGSRTKPLVGLNNATLATRGTGDRVFAFSGTYNHGFIMAASERLIGQAATGSFDAHFAVAVPANGTLDSRPSMSGAAVTLQSTLTAANNTLARGLTLSTGANKGYVATGATTLTVLESSVNATGNMAIDVTGATNAATSVAFTSTSSGGGTRGVSLDGVNGTWSLGSGTLSANTQAAFYLQNSNASIITYSGSMAPNAAGRAVLIGTADGLSGTNSSNGMEAGTTVTLSGNITAGGVAVYESTGGTLNLTGATQTWSTGATKGVDLIDNHNGSTGATINFSGGNLNITTSSGTGFHASEGGTVNVTGTDNVINATANGIGLEFFGASGATMGGNHTWKSISANGGGVADWGIRVQHTTGTFSVTGDDNNDGNPDSLTAGGTIQNIEDRGAEFSNVTGAVSLAGMTFTNAATTNGVAVATCGLPITGDTTQCNAAIHLVNATVSTSLRTIKVSGSAQQGINANNVTNLTMHTIEVTGAGNETDESGVLLTDLKGSGSVTNSNFHDNHTRAMHIANKSGVLAAFPIKGTTFDGSLIAQGLLVELHNSGTIATVVVGGAGADACTFSDTFGNGFEAAASSNANLTFTVNGSTVTNTNGVVGANAAAGGFVTTTLTNNSFIAGANTAAGVISLASSNGGTLTADIISNTIGGVTAGSGTACAGCNGMFINPHSSSPSDIEIRGNIIQNVNGSGIFYAAGNVGGTYNHRLAITGNVIRDPGANATTSNPALQIRNGITSGTDGITGTADDDAGCVALTLGGSTNAGGASTNTDAMNVFEDSWNGGGSDIFLFTRFATTTKLPSYAAPFDTYVRARNVVLPSPTQTVSALHQNTSTATPGTSCP